MNRIVLIVIGILLTSNCIAFELTLPSIFADHMVLQRNQNVPVWGTSEAGAIIEVVFAGQSKTVKADVNGNWRIDLEPMTASSESRIMTISSKRNGESTEFKILDVLVGEVWLAGGQSNMYRPFRMLTDEAREPVYEPIAEYLRNEENTANDTLLRQFRVGKEFNVLEENNEGKGTWSKAVKGPVHEFGATGYFFGRELRRELEVPVAIIACNLGGTKIEPWMPIQAYQSKPILNDYYIEELDSYKDELALWDQEKVDSTYQKQLAEWEITVKNAKAKGEKEPSKPRKQEHPDRNKQTASTLYNGMLHPLIPYAIKGAIWYQGESNGDNLPEQYAIRLTAMVEAWREAWNQKDFYFLYCQLANYKDPIEQPVEEVDGWVIIQNQMRLALDVIPNSGMAVLNDIGEAKDIHPKNKIDVGKRLSLWALSQAYEKDLVYSGPLYKQSEVKGNKLIITFDQVGSGLMTGKKHLLEPTIEVNEPLKRFQICGADRQWKWANAEIIGTNKVEVWHEDISKPVEVRYAWSPNPEGANLYNKEGLPTYVFTTID
ncbi:sialate O-acetylesterase [Formosa sp. PL04]|uniref:sialate O-acetylesterase n=1 Tax=Formosa sp. PL04 TaxID=3081755 RepID=UPI002982645E|nr:sialate O-acetylesterase [Formosa sp. PL04]MDW5288506.1 sialate O-acetylesterase [Formosa sp. PL04]